ncbi:MAG TPA: type VI secretion system baseplate subunit TssF [Verrucomicrobiae bacterium]|jgi:type VI secretion system protein ImpG|nr:type VI secretion system baseplate subunit TssF [Verrucomicrobiae bacterium]
MDERLLEHYNNELRHVRETAGEFAREFPKIAGRLALDKDAKDICPDPYVERLLEGFAWLAARIHLKLDAEFPRFTQSLLETVYPHFLPPTPSMAVVRFDPEEGDAALAAGVVIPRGTLLRSNLGKGERTACTFQTAHPVRLLPIKLVEARYFTRDLVQLNLPAGVPAKAAIRLRLQVAAAVPFKEVQLDPLAFFLRGADEFPSWIYEQIFARKTALVLQAPEDGGRTLGVLPARSIRALGFAGQEALLPATSRSFEGYRMLREYFAFPQRYRFFELGEMADAVKLCKGNQIDIIIALKDVETRLEGRLDASYFELFSTPALNLFSKQLDRIDLSRQFSEFQVVADRNRPLDFEVFEIESVRGYGSEPGQEQEFRPFYLAKDTDVDTGAFYTTNRVPRVLTTKEKQFGRRSNYAGTEVYLSLVDANSAPYRPDLRQLGVKALCTNRHLPIQMAVGLGRTDFTMDLSAPVKSIRCLAGPTLPVPSLAEGRFSWRLISHLSLNYLSLVDSKTEGGAAGLREMLKLYSQPGDRQMARQIEGVLSVQSRPVLRRVTGPGPITFARGLEITVNFDETALEGIGVFIMGAVVEQFLAKYVALNSFTETVIRTQQRGEIMRWPTRMGKRQIL